MNDNEANHTLRNQTLIQRLRALILIPAAIIVCILAGCKEKNSMHPDLQRAETVMYTLPDSAYKIIMDIDTTTLSSDFDRAAYSVLRAQAEDKCDLDITRFPYLEEAVTFFENISDEKYMMLSNLYFGKACLKVKDYTKSIIALTKAEQLAVKLGDNFNAGLSSQEQQSVYMDIYDAQSELQAVKRARQYYNKAGASRHELYSRGFTCIALYNNRSYEETIDSCRALLTEPMIWNEPHLLASCFSIMGSSFLETDQVDSALVYLERVINEYPQYALVVDYIFCGEIYYMKGNIAKAREYSDLIDSLTEDSSVLKLRMARDRHDYKEENEVLQKQMEWQNRVIERVLSQSVSSALSALHAAQERQLNPELKETRLTIMSIVIGSILIIMALVSIFWLAAQRHRQNEREKTVVVEEMQSSITSLQERIRILDASTEISARGVMASLQSFKDLLKVYIKTLEPDKDEEKESAAHVYQIMKKNTDQFISEKTMPDLICAANAISGNLIIDLLKSAIPDILTEDLKLYILLVLGFRGPVCATLLHSDVRAVYNRKNRLKNRIINSDSPHKDELLKYM